MKRTKIVCTIGPASEKKSVLEKMIKAGMDTARINFSHFSKHSYGQYETIIDVIRKTAKINGKAVAILQDLQGPRIRLGKLSKDGLVLEKGDKVVLSTDLSRPTLDKLPINYPRLQEDIKVGDPIFMDDGLIKFRAVKIQGRSIECRVMSGGILISYRGVNFPKTVLSLPSLTEKDKIDLEFGVKSEVDFAALSFVNKKEDILELRSCINRYSKKFNRGKKSPIRIIAKIETFGGVRNFKEILEAADGVMVARGDLGIEMPPQDVPLIQKKIIGECLKVSKPVIVATQMLDSMISKSRPTRAEVSDVANAVIDHTDAVMLSGETALGKYPVKTVQTMAKIIKRTEDSIYDNIVISEMIEKIMPIDTAISSAATILAGSVRAKAILVASLSGYTGRIVSRFRPELPIFVATTDGRVERQLSLSWGVVPFLLPSVKSVEDLVEKSIKHLIEKRHIKKNDTIIIVAGQPVGKSGNVNFIKIHKL